MQRRHQKETWETIHAPLLLLQMNTIHHTRSLDKCTHPEMEGPKECF